MTTPMKKEICVSTSKFKNKRVMVPLHIWQILAVYKVFFPPTTMVHLGKNTPIPIKNILVDPPPPQGKMDI